MIRKECPKCGGVMAELAGQFVVLHAGDVPAFGSKTEIMITPKMTLRVFACRCENPSCLFVEFYAS